MTYSVGQLLSAFVVVVGE